MVGRLITEVEAGLIVGVVVVIILIILEGPGMGELFELGIRVEDLDLPPFPLRLPSSVLVLS